MGRRHTDSRAPGGELLGPLLIVSPHFDDVPFSCWALLDRRDLATVLHVCTAGPVPPVVAEWDRRSGFADSDAATAARRAEERDAFAGTPHLFREVGLLDGQYTDVRTVDELRRISDAVHAWVDEVDAPCTVAVPVGAGCVEGALVPIARLRARLSGGQLFWMHPDHVAVREACLAALLERPEVAVVLYEEFPYRITQRGNRAARAAVRQFGHGARLERFELAVDRNDKARRLHAYATQLPVLLPADAWGVEQLARFLPPAERYWRIER